MVRKKDGFARLPEHCEEILLSGRPVVHRLRNRLQEKEIPLQLIAQGVVDLQSSLV